MTISTNYNPSSLSVQRYLSNATNSLNKALERMSTGFRVNYAADDAAGMYVATNMNTQIRGLRQAQKNTLTGNNVLNTAQGALNNMSDLLNRIRDLSVQASNDTYGAMERAAMQKEIDALTAQYVQIKSGTNFNGKQLFETPVSTNSLASTLAASGSWKLSTPEVKSPTSGGKVNAPAYPVPGLPPDDIKVDESNNMNGDTPDEYFETHKYDPGVQLTGEEMNALKYWLKAGEKYEDFSAQIALGMKAEEILAAKKIEKPEFEVLPMAIVENGTIDFDSKQTKVVSIGGVNYTITNKASTAKSVIWAKDDAGVLNFDCTSFEIRGQSDVSHNIEINSDGNTIYGGDKDDIIKAKSSKNAMTYVYAGAGNDTLIDNGSYVSTYYLQSGNNTMITNTGSVYAPRIIGGTGNDTINLNRIGSAIDLSAGGNNVVNMFTGDHTITGGSGDDTYNFLSTSVNACTIKDSSGNNIINNTINNSRPNNSILGNFTINGLDKFIRLSEVSFGANEEKTVTLSDGKRYLIKNNGTAEKTLLTKVVSGRMTIVEGTGFTIKALEKSTVEIIGENAYYCSSFGDDVKGEASIYSGTAANIINASGGLIYLQGSGNTVTTTNGNVYNEKGDNNITITNIGNVYALNGNSVINVNNSSGSVYGGTGNNTFNLNASYAAAFGGQGNDTFVIKAGVDNTSCIGGGGNNTISGDIAGAKFISEMSNAINNATSVALSSSASNVDIDGSNYTFTQRNSYAFVAAYSVDVDGTVNLIGHNVNITADSSKYNKINTYGTKQEIRGGDAGNTITKYSAWSSLIYGGNGDDTLISKRNSSGDTLSGLNGDNTYIAESTIGTLITGNGNNTIILYSTVAFLNAGSGNNRYIINCNGITMSNGGHGDNVYEINGNDCNITAGTGSDSFTVNGNNNKVFGAAGNDYFAIISGTANNVIGGTGTNYIVDNGIGTITNFNDVINDPNSGFLQFTDNFTSQTITLFGKTYTVTNTTTQGSLQPVNMLRYTYNTKTNEMMFMGSGFTISASNNSDHNIIVRGDNNVIQGGNGNDKITVAEGTNNKLEGGEGNDTLTANSEKNILAGGGGNDKLIANADYTVISGISGNNIIEANSDFNTINGGSGNETITVKGNENSIDAGAGDDKVYVTGAKNTINSSAGSDYFGIKGNDNTLNETGNANNTVAIDGENNTASLGDGNNKITVITSNTNVKGNIINAGNGSNNINVQGNLNQISTGSGSDIYSVNGAGNIIDGGDGNNNIDVRFGNNNSIVTGSGNDVFTVKSNENHIQAGAGNDNFTVNGSRNNIKGGDGNDYFNVRTSANDNILDGEGGKNRMINYGLNTNFTNVSDVTPAPIVFRFQVGANGDKHSSISFQTGFSVEDLDVSVDTVENARAGIELIDTMLSQINQKVSEIGSVIGRFDSVLQSQTTQIENLTASMSTIMDADIAQESADFVKNQILQQTGAVLLAQSQSTHKNSILGLIRT